MKHVGDITKINGAEIEPVDVIIGGSPCQDLSVAGKRSGLAGKRSGLYMEQIRVVKEMREHERRNGRTGFLVRPRYMLWENVPGAFSSNKGRDFAAVIEEAIRIAEPEAPDVPVPEKGWPKSGCLYSDLGEWSLAWCVRDAQFWGVPQRRKRIALIIDFGGMSAPEILFERKGMRGHFAQSEKSWKGTAGHVEVCLGAADRAGTCVAYSFDSLASNSMKSKNPHSGCRQVEIAKTLDCFDPSPAKNQGGIAVLQPVEMVQEDKSATLATNNDQYPFQSVATFQNTGRGWWNESGVGATLRTPCGGDSTLANVVVQTVYGNILDEQGEQQIAVRTDGKAPTLRAETHGNLPCVLEAAGFKSGQGAKARSIGWEEEICSSLAAEAGGNSVPSVCVKCYDARGNGDGEIVSTLTGDHESRITDYTTVLCMAHGQANAEICEDKSPCLNCNHEQPIVAGVDCRNMNEYPELYPTLQAKPNGGQSLNFSGACRIRYMVRRLTPTECERLQGFPDGWTDIGEWIDSKGKLHKSSDSARYKALGNSIALPPWKYILKRISAQYERDATLGSLFDGIGGFPLIWEQINGKGSARWASEIEEFPIAVTKKRLAGSEAVAVMRAQQEDEKNDPLTLDELREMDGQPVWIDDWIEPYNGWELSEDASDYFEGRDVKKYGSAWVAYRRPPKEDAK